MEEMKAFFHQNILTMADTFERATGEQGRWRACGPSGTLRRGDARHQARGMTIRRWRAGHEVRVHRVDEPRSSSRPCPFPSW